ncbi:transferase [Lithospermum erythrorhizon]|uniref:Transferase n=1 Tax=Lithospermum erythrorhizon TaxID=34254 RepID=A0AAV3RC35_LITER
MYYLNNKDQKSHTSISKKMDFSLTRSNGNLVAPINPTPSEVLDLSFIDKLPVLRCYARTLHVFKHGPNAAQIIRMGLSKALVPYYPLAGRLKESENELQIDCSGEGVWFVEASADCKLDDVDYFDDAMTIPYDKLLPEYLPEGTRVDPLVLVQVTKFECDGFVMGLTFCHSICDGLGAAQFLNAVGEFAKGCETPTIVPIWSRNFIKSPKTNTIIPFPNMPPPMPDYNLEHAKLDIPHTHINQLKKTFQELTGKTCSTFEVVSAHLWSTRTRAIKFPTQTELKLVFFANCRNIIDKNQPLPKGYYGNCFFPVTITSSSNIISNSSNAEIVKLIQEAKERLPQEFEKWVNGEMGGVDPFAPPLVYSTLFISEWGRLGFNQVDYGWGPPTLVVPVQGSSIIPVGIVGTLPYPGKGIRLMTWCVEKAHFNFLMDQASSLS